MNGASSLDAFLGAVCEKDNISRQQIYPELVAYLREPSSNVACEDFVAFLDGVLGWISASNPKIIENGLEILALLANRLQTDFAAYFDTVFRALFERLADKERIQDRVGNVFVKLITCCTDDPSDVCKRLLPAFSNKQMRVREGAALCIQKALAEVDAGRLPVDQVSVALATSYAEPLATNSMRQVAGDTLIELYRQAGECVYNSVQQSGIPANLMATLTAKFDAVAPLDSGNVQQVVAENVFDDDSAPQPSEVFKRPAPTRRPSGRTATGSTSGSSSQVTQAAASGAVNDDIFVQTFEETPRVEFYSSRELSTQLQNIVDTISDLSKDWDRRNNAMRTLRGIVKHGSAATDTDEFAQTLRLLETAFQTTLKDLRSMVIREACITIAYMAQQLGNSLEHFTETVMPNIIPLIPNTIAVIASSAVVGLRFLVAHVHSPKILPIIAQFVGSKAKEVRAAMFGYVAQILRGWPEKLLEKQREKLLDLIKKGLRDADPAARQHSRDAFKAYAKYFRESALHEIETMDSRERKTLGELINRDSDTESVKSGASMSTTGTLSKRGSFRGGKGGPPVSQHASGVHYSLPRANSQERPLAVGDGAGNHAAVTTASWRAAARSTSTADHADSVQVPRRSDGASSQLDGAVDTSAYYAPPMPTSTASRTPLTYAHAAYPYATQPQTQPYLQTNGVAAQHAHGYVPASLQQAAPGYAQPQADLTHAYRVTTGNPVQHASSTAYRAPNHRVTQPPVAPSAVSTAQLISASRNTTVSARRRVAASQPGSRSGSPPREQHAEQPTAYHPPTSTHTTTVMQTRTLGRRTPSTSTATAAAAAPTAGGASKVSRIPRSVTSSREPSPARSYTTLPNRQNSHQSAGQAYMHPDLNAMNALGQPLNDYVAYPDADENNIPPEDRSETSSVSRFSDTSRRYRGSECCSASDSFLARLRLSRDINEIMAYMASAQWQDRRNGLAGFQCYLSNCRPLEPAELKAITDFFTRFFNDPNAKVFIALLETLTEFIPQHRDSLYDWMYIPLTRLLLKLGSANLLGSVETRILQALDIVRNNFPLTLQFSAVCRFIIDQTQTPNCKAKLATLKFLVNTIEVMAANDFVMDSDNKLAVARLITWTVDRQSPDLRKAAALCIFKLFDLNAAEFIRLLRELSRVFQDGAYKLLIVHVRGMQSTSQQHQGELALSQLQLNGTGRPDELAPPLTPSGSLLSPTPSDFSATSQTAPYGTNYVNNFPPGARSRTSSTSSSSTSVRQFLRNERGVPSPTSSRAPVGLTPGSDSENLNPEALMRDFTKTAEGIAQLNQTAANDDLPAPNRTPQSLGTRQSMPTNGVSRVVNRSQPHTPSTPPGNNIRQFISSTQNDAQVSHSVPKQPTTPPSNVLTGTPINNAPISANRTNTNATRTPQTVSIDLRTTLPIVLESLSMLNDKYAERKQAFGTLVQLARHASANPQANADWNEHFRKVLFSVLETLKDNDTRMRYVALLTLAQLIEANGEPFSVAPEMTMLKLFELHKETAIPSSSEVTARDMTRYADDCLARLGLCVPKQVTLRVAINVIRSAEYPLDLAALKLVNKLVDHDRVHAAGATMRPAVLDILGELVPAVLLAYNSPQGALRKASVFCLVSIIMLVGDSELRKYLEKLPAPKLKLLDVYIKRAQDDQAAAAKVATEDTVIVPHSLAQDFERCLLTFWKN